MPAKCTFVLVEYEDEYGIDQKPFFAFNPKMLDLEPWKEQKLISAVYRQMKNKPTPKEQKISEDPLKILKLRYAKGQISKEEYEEIKNTLQE